MSDTLLTSVQHEGPLPNQEELKIDALYEETLRKIEQQAGPELAPIFTDVLKRAITLEPGLQGIEVSISSEIDSDFTGGAARHADKSPNNRHGIKIDVSRGLDGYADLMKVRPQAAEITARKLGVPSDELTPELLAAFIFAHELGHAVDYSNESYAVFAARRTKDLATLPIPELSPSRLARELAPGGLLEDWEENLNDLTDRGITDHTISGILAAQELTYRALPTEDSADQFAVSLLT